MDAMHVLQQVPSPPRADGPELLLHVVYTTPDATRAGLKAASLLAHDLGATVELLVPHVVPFPLPLHEPTSPAGFLEETISALISGCEVDVQVRVLLCRDREETIPKWLPADAVAIIGRRRRWGPGAFRSLIRAIKRSGHRVVVIDAARAPEASAAISGRQTSR